MQSHKILFKKEKKKKKILQTSTEQYVMFITIN